MASESKWTFRQRGIAGLLLRWCLLVIPMAIGVGCLVAFFLWLLEWATHTREQNMWLIWLLPVAGIFIYAVYHLWGQRAEAGNNLVLDEIHQPGGGVPLRMAPLVLFSTVITHLFGGSAGREGTAVQIGGSLADWFCVRFGMSLEDRQIFLTCGMAAGFGAVFGTPLTGALFAIEVLAIGRVRYSALWPCLLASFVAEFTCGLFPLDHTGYAIQPYTTSAGGLLSALNLDPVLLIKVLVAGAIFGLASNAFARLAHGIKGLASRLIPVKWTVPVLGAFLVLGISSLLGTYDYLGLGVTSADPNGVSIVSAFSAGGADAFSWFWKLLLTAITLSMGFKGGEVTPLFFIGATLGNTLAMASGTPVDLLAGLGFIAVFAGATNTPIACTMMGVELFGVEYVAYYAVVCFVAYYFSGHKGIYQSQRIMRSKFYWLLRVASLLRGHKKHRKEV